MSAATDALATAAKRYRAAVVMAQAHPASMLVLREVTDSQANLDIAIAAYEAVEAERKGTTPTMRTTILLTKPGTYLTRSGYQAHVFALDGKEPDIGIGVVHAFTGVKSWNDRGHFGGSGPREYGPHSFDLVSYVGPIEVNP